MQHPGQVILSIAMFDEATFGDAMFGCCKVLTKPQSISLGKAKSDTVIIYEGILDRTVLGEAMVMFAKGRVDTSEDTVKTIRMFAARANVSYTFAHCIVSITLYSQTSVRTRTI